MGDPLPPPPPPPPLATNGYEYGVNPSPGGYADDGLYWEPHRPRAPTPPPPRIVEIIDDMGLDKEPKPKKKSKDKEAEKPKPEPILEPVGNSYEGYMLERLDPLKGERATWARVGKRLLPFDDAKLVDLVKKHRKQSRTTPATDFAALSSNQQGVINRLLAEKMATEQHPNATWSVVDVQNFATYNWKTKDVRKIQVILKRHSKETATPPRPGSSAYRTYQTEEIIDLSAPLPTKKKDKALDPDKDEEKTSKKDKSDDKKQSKLEDLLGYEDFYPRQHQDQYWPVPEMRQFHNHHAPGQQNWNPEPRPPYPYNEFHQDQPIYDKPPMPPAFQEQPRGPPGNYEPYQEQHTMHDPYQGQPAIHDPYQGQPAVHDLYKGLSAQPNPPALPQDDPNHYQPPPAMYNPRRPPVTPTDPRSSSTTLPSVNNPFAADFDLTKIESLHKHPSLIEPVYSSWIKGPATPARSQTPELTDRQKKDAKRNKRIGELEDEVLALRNKVEDMNMNPKSSRTSIEDREYYTTSPTTESFSPPPTPPLPAVTPAGSLHTHLASCRGSPCSCHSDGSERRSRRRSHHDADLALTRTSQPRRRASPRRAVPSRHDEDAMRYIESTRRMRGAPQVYIENSTHPSRRLRRQASSHSVDFHRFGSGDEDYDHQPLDDWNDTKYHRMPDYGHADRPHRISRTWTNRY